MSQKITLRRTDLEAEDATSPSAVNNKPAQESLREPISNDVLWEGLTTIERPTETQT